jgi:sugar-specific transcriptional regulator TrmB
MEKEVCNERHIRIDEKLENHDKRLDNYAVRLDKLEQVQSEFRIEIKNLCDNLKSLTAALKWFICLILGSFVAFFFYAAEKGLIK